MLTEPAPGRQEVGQVVGTFIYLTRPRSGAGLWPGLYQTPVPTKLRNESHLTTVGFLQQNDFIILVQFGLLLTNFYSISLSVLNMKKYIIQHIIFDIFQFTLWKFGTDVVVGCPGNITSEDQTAVRISRKVQDILSFKNDLLRENTILPSLSVHLL